MRKKSILRKNPDALALLARVIYGHLFENRLPLYSNLSHIAEAIKWLCIAQDRTNDRGVSEGYHLFHGWLPSYPETTGYIIETFFDYFKLTGDESYKNRAIRMADWLVGIQNYDGSIPDSRFSSRMVFDTGQVVFGFVRTYEETGEEKYKTAALKAGEWLIKVQEEDGSWRKYALNGIPHTYYTRVAWSLAKLHSITKDDIFLTACAGNVQWAIRQQQENGWFNKASFDVSNHDKPYTHTIAYTIRGILEVGLYLQQRSFIESAKLAMDNLVETIPHDGRVYGTYDKHWNGDKRFTCLTGNAQLAIVLFRLYEMTMNGRYLEVAKKINSYLKSKQEIRVKNKRVYGAVAGSYPIWGKYMHFTYPNWASKFFADALMLEAKHYTE